MARHNAHILTGVLVPMLAGLLVSQCAVAQDILQPELQRQVIVTAAAPLDGLVFVVDPKQPRQPLPASDGADYLQTVPGFSAIRNGGSNGDPVLRGLFGSRLNVLTDGGTLAGACPSRMDNALSYVAPETFDRLVIIKGPQSVIWGPGASAGTVRFERDKIHFEAPGHYGSASLSSGSHARNDQVVDATMGARMGYLRVSGSRSRADDYRDGDGRVVPSRWDKWSADTAVGWTPDAHTRVELALGAGDGEARYAGRGMDGSQFRRDSIGVDLSRQFDGSALQLLEVNASDQHADHVMDNYSLREPDEHGPMPGAMASNVDRRTRAGRMAATWQWGDRGLVAGMDGHSSLHRGRNGHGRDTWQHEPRIADARFRMLGLFAELVQGKNSAQRWIAGARVDRAKVEDLRMDGSGDHEHAHGVAVHTGHHASRTDIRRQTLRSGFVRHERDLQQVPLGFFAGIGRVERMPDYWELFSPREGPPGSANAFSAVSPERTTQIDVGMQYRSRRLEAWTSLYAGRIDDFVLIRYHGTASQALPVDARIHGAEAGGRWQLSSHWSLAGSLAWAWGANRSDNKPLPQMPPLEGQVGLDYARDDWSAGLLLRGARAQRRNASGDGNIVGRDIGPSAGFGVLSINGGYRFGSALQLTAGIDNLLDRTYAEHLNLAGNAGFGYPADPLRINEPGRQAWLRLGLIF